MADASCPVRVGLYVPGEALPGNQIRPSPPPHRRSSGARLGTLETLDEVSHSNALHLRAGSAGNQEDTTGAVLPRAQRALAEARRDKYSFVVTDLTTPLWKKRWDTMCLEVPDPTLSTPDTSTGVGVGLVPSSSRLNLAAAASGNSLATGTASNAFSVVRQAELWRANPSFREHEVHLTTAEATPNVSVLLSSWIELDATDEGVRLDAELALIQEVSYAAHIGAAEVVLPSPSSDPERRRFLPHYARAVAACLSPYSASGTVPVAGTAMTLVIRLPITSPHELARRLSRGQISPDELGRASPLLGGRPPAVAMRIDDDWAWDSWTTIQKACHGNPRVKVLLDLAAPMPNNPLLLNRWASEPVFAVWVPASSFWGNSKGFPVFGKQVQALVRALLPQKPRVILSGTTVPNPLHAKGNSAAYLTYVKYWLNKSFSELPGLDDAVLSEADRLQAPFQPVLDQLDSSSYRLSERDEAKYNVYEDAITAALIDMTRTGRAQGVVQIWVCGAGRGPLVSRCLAAAVRSRTQVHVTALEKNPHAAVVLHERQAHEWGENRVSVRLGDMRLVPPPVHEAEKADIVVSQLLGSFGDNELGPECLDGAMRFLKVEGISIPVSYCNYVTPITAPHLHSEATGTSVFPPLADEPKRKALETPRSVLMKQVGFPAGRGGRGGWEAVQAVWAFQHGPIDMTSPVCDSTGLPFTNAHNVRTAARTFFIPQASVVHGLAGYFEARLYGDIGLSILPEARTSAPVRTWPPLFLPFSDPLYLPPGSELDVHLWRMSASRRVWYEWYAESSLPLPVALVAPTMSAQHSQSPLLEPLAPGSAQGYVSPVLADGTQPAAGGEPAGMFQNAPVTPALVATRHMDGTTPLGTPLTNPNSVASAVGTLSLTPRLSAGRAASVTGGSPSTTHAPLPNVITRIKTNVTSLMNPGGRSWRLSL